MNVISHSGIRIRKSMTTISVADRCSEKVNSGPKESSPSGACRCLPTHLHEKRTAFMALCTGPVSPLPSEHLHRHIHHQPVLHIVAIGVIARGVVPHRDERDLR